MDGAGKIDIFSTIEIMHFPGTDELIEIYNTLFVEKYYSARVLNLSLPGESYDDILKRIDHRIFISHPAPEQPSGYVYLIRVSFCEDTMYKIGITNNVKKRMGDLLHQGYNPEVIAYLDTSESRRIEKELHGKLIEFHHSFTYQNNYPKWSYEYFDFDQEQLKRVIQIIKSYDPIRFTLI
jgi:hypothetical protein